MSRTASSAVPSGSAVKFQFPGSLAQAYASPKTIGLRLRMPAGTRTGNGNRPGACAPSRLRHLHAWA